jgi:DNA polymerase-3 subunit epsilon
MVDPGGWCASADTGAVSLDFTAIEFETANQQPGAVCAVGLVRVRDGRVVHKSGGLVRPPEGLGEFADFNTSIHGITAEMLAGAPTWRRVAAWIVDYTGQDILISHNAGFNIGVLRHACTADEIPWPQANFLCTMVLARKAFQLPSYRLPFVAAECGVELVGRHQVLINARGTALIAVAMAQQHEASTPTELADALGINMGRLEPGRYIPTVRRDTRGAQYRLATPGAGTDANLEHPLYGRVIVFTGTLKSRTRQQAWNDVAKVGGIPEKDVSSRTNILVVGELNPAVLTPGATTSGKAARAFALQSKGQDIEVMTEADFIRSL